VLLVAFAPLNALIVFSLYLTLSGAFLRGAKLSLQSNLFLPSSPIINWQPTPFKKDSAAYTESKARK
jgi:hypothetical protein